VNEKMNNEEEEDLPARAEEPEKGNCRMAMARFAMRKLASSRPEGSRSLSFSLKWMTSREKLEEAPAMPDTTIEMATTT